MVQQLGIPTLFFSLSSADTNWSNLLVPLGKLLHDKSFTETDLDQMNREEKCTLVSLHPTACARYFNHHVQKFFKHVLHSPFSPFGKL